MHESRSNQRRGARQAVREERIQRHRDERVLRRAELLDDADTIHHDIGSHLREHA